MNVFMHGFIEMNASKQGRRKSLLFLSRLFMCWGNVGKDNEHIHALIKSIISILWHTP